MPPNEFDAFYDRVTRNGGIDRPAWEGVQNQRPPRPMPRQMRPPAQRANDPRLAQSERDRALRQFDRSNAANVDTYQRQAFDQRNQVAEAANMAAESTGLPAIRRASSDLTRWGAYTAGTEQGNDDLASGALNLGAGSLGVLGMAGMVPRAPMRGALRPPVTAPEMMAPPRITRPPAQAPDAGGSRGGQQWAGRANAAGDPVIVGSAGERQPVRVYHGTTRDFENFTTGNASNGATSDAGMALFFAENPETARIYSRSSAVDARSSANRFRQIANGVAPDQRQQLLDLASRKEAHESLVAQARARIDAIDTSTGGFNSAITPERRAAVKELEQLLDNPPITNAEVRAAMRPRVVEAELNLTNPRRVNMRGQDWSEDLYASEIEAAKRAGNDGVIFEGVREPGAPADNVYAVFDPSVIRPNAPARSNAGPQRITRPPTEIAPNGMPIAPPRPFRNSLRGGSSDLMDAAGMQPDAPASRPAALPAGGALRNPSRFEPQPMGPRPGVADRRADGVGGRHWAARLREAEPQEGLTLLGELRADVSLSAAELKQIAQEFVGAPINFKSKIESFSAIEERLYRRLRDRRILGEITDKAKKSQE